MKTIAFVPAKYNSNRIKNKNLQIIDGEYLFKKKLIQLIQCREIDEVWLDSESKYLHELTKDLPIKHFYRPKILASNKTDGHQMFEYQSQITRGDIIVQALCTSPFLESKTIDRALKLLKKSNKKSLIAVQKNKFYTWEKNKPSYGKKIPNSVDLKDTIIETMSFYAVKTFGKKVKKRYTKNPIMFELNPLESIDINNNLDLDLANKISAGIRLKNYQNLKSLSKIISSPLISDICKDLKIKHFLSSNIKSLNGGKFLGFAKTLKLKSIKSKKEWKGIYKALGTYKFIQPGDVIVVSNKTDKAYFGELNASYAYRSGAVGVVVDGFTRDVEAVTKIGLPVFAHGHKADDIKFEGTFDEMNMPININDIIIKNNDLIFADQDGVVCVPQEKWSEVLKKLKTNLKKEMMIKLESSFGLSPELALKKIGLF